MTLDKYFASLWSSKIRYNLSNIKELLSYLNDPQLKLPPTIHVSGTNGKGSTVAMFKSIFMNKGLKVHAYISPHLIKLNERITVSNKEITDEYLYQVCKDIIKVSYSRKIELTFFEAITAAAFLAFSENPADILILETGMGGRLDATNTIENSILTLITPISYDHTKYLGSTLTKIAREKAGIIKKYTPCVISYQVDKVRKVLIELCKKEGVIYSCYNIDFYIKKLDKSFFYTTNIKKEKFPAPSLLGDHQLVNASAVISGMYLINKHFNTSSYDISLGLINTFWPARIQKVNFKDYKHILNCNLQIWLDGAHNDSGAEVLSNWVANSLGKKVFLIIGMMKDKRVEKFCSYFNGLVKGAYAVQVLSEPKRSYKAQILSKKASKSLGVDCLDSESLEKSLLEIKKVSQEKVEHVVLTGSLFLIADFFKLIQKN